MKELEQTAHQQAGHEFNLGSPKQLGEVLFEELGIQGSKKTKSGGHQTGAEVLEGLAAQGHELPATVLAWRQLQKLTGTYTDALINQIAEVDGRVHTSYAMTVTSTGRLSSNDPNLQNIPIRTEEGRKIRKAFVAEDGHVLLSADYSQIELRVLAHMADIEALKKAFAEGEDIHATTASQMFDVPLDKMDGELRRRAKTINFGIIYGIGPYGLSQRLGIPFEDAKNYISAYFEQYPGIKDYMDRAKAEAKEQGFVSTLYGRMCPTPEIKSSNPARRGYAERAAINAPIQGTAADIMKRAMIQVDRALSRSDLGAKMLLQVHDELVFEVPEGEAEATADLVKKTMENAAFLDVPLTVEVGTGCELGRRALSFAPDPIGPGDLIGRKPARQDRTSISSACQPLRTLATRPTAGNGPKRNLNRLSLELVFWSMRSWDSEPGIHYSRAGGLPGSHGPDRQA